MAQRVSIQLVDDLDESLPATETVVFGVDGSSYEIDLSEANAARLREALAPYVGVARKVSATTRRSSSRGSTAGGPSTSDVRDWARSNGYEVSDRGRVSAEVRRAYDAAH